MNARWMRLFVTTLLIAASCGLRAESEIDMLVEQTGIELGAVAARDIPGWRSPEKIVIRDIGLPQDEIRAALPGVEIVFVRTEAEAFASACWHQVTAAVAEARGELAPGWPYERGP